MNNDILRDYISNNVLSTAESCNYLGVSRQTLNQYLKEGKIEPVKTMPNGMLFLREDIVHLMEEQYKKRNAHNMLQKRKIIGDGSTSKSLSYIMDNITLNDIICVRVYFNTSDAVLDGYYLSPNEYIKNKLTYVEAPNFIITLNNGEEIWLNGLLCGYNGEGPRGTECILQQLKIDDNKIEKLFSSYIIEYKRCDEGWECTTFDKRSNIGEEDERPDICLFNNNLVLLQYERLFRYKADDTILFYNRYKNFLSTPKTLTVYTRNKAIETGHYDLTLLDDTLYYQVIIKDIVGREIWLRCNINEDIPIYKNEKLLQILKAHGIGFSNKEKGVETIKYLLSKKVTMQEITVYDIN